MQKFKAIEQHNHVKCFPNQLLLLVLFQKWPNSQVKQNVLHLSGLVYSFYPFSPMILFLSKSNTRAFCSQNPLHAFCNPASMRKIPQHQRGLSARIWHQPQPLFSLVVLEIQQDVKCCWRESVREGGRKRGYSDAIQIAFQIIAEELTANDTK